MVRSSGLAKVATLYRGSITSALRFAALLVAALFALVVLVLVSLPQQLFTANDVPRISLALVYGDNGQEDELLQSLNTQLLGIETIESIRLSTPEEAETLLTSGEVDAVVTLPEETLDVLLYGGHATITVRAEDPVIGSVVYTVASSGVETLDTVQNYALTYAEEARAHFTSSEAYSEAVSGFYLKLLGEALTRVNNVDIPWQVSP